MNDYDPITNTESFIDSRDVIARIEYLREEARAAFIEENPDAADCVLVDDDYSLDGPAAWLDEDEGAELKALEALAEEGEGLADWAYGETLIRDDYFEDYAREMAEDIGAIPSEHTWPLYCIDWERAANELKMDYTAIDFGGVTYWGRS